jgi:transcriptional regulator with XRE-family HTH domain
MSGAESLVPERENIGQRVKRLRIERGYSQDRLAIEARVDQSGLSKFERGGRGFGRLSLQKIADVLGIPFNALIEGTDFNVP